MSPLFLIALHLLVAQQQLLPVFNFASAENAIAAESTTRPQFSLPQIKNPLANLLKGNKNVETDASLGEVTKGPNFMNRFSTAVSDAIAPAKAYADLVNRYHKWYRRYNRLQKEAPVPMKGSLEVLQIEYGKIDERLKSGACPMKRPKFNDGKSSDDADDAESRDFVFKVLLELIENLELKFERLKLPDNNKENIEKWAAAINEELRQSPEEEARTKAAMERIKKQAIEIAANVAKSEALNVAKIAAFDALAVYVDAQQSAGVSGIQGDVLFYLAPIVHMLGSTTTPVAVAYLRNVQRRAAMAVINQANPINFFKQCAGFKKATTEAPMSQK